MNDQVDTLQALALLQLTGVGPVTARKILLSCVGEPLETAIRRFLPTFKDADWIAAQTKAHELAERCDQLNISIIGYKNSNFPPRLKKIPDPPVVIYVKGNSSVLLQDAIAVVGTRNVSAAGARLTKIVAGYVSKRGFVVVSGLALGVDALAHEAALEEHALTVAVLAHGLDTVSPTSHKKLAERILATGGALISEHPPGFPARPPEFVRRNRIQSGLSLGSIIVESNVEGGSMHQARFTKAQGRHLMTVLAHSDETRGDLNEAGARELIEKLGAAPLKTTGDLGKELDLLKQRKEIEGPPSQLL